MLVNKDTYSQSTLSKLLSDGLSRDICDHKTSAAKIY